MVPTAIPTPICGELNQTCCPPNPPESYDSYCNNVYLKCGNDNKCVNTSTPICGETGQTCCPPNPPEHYSDYCNSPYLICDAKDRKCKSTSASPVPTIPFVPNPTAVSTPMPALQPGQACRTDVDCGQSTKPGCAVQCVTDYCPGNSGCGKTEGTAGVLNCQLYPPTGTVWNSGYSACVGVLTPVNPPPPPGPTNPPTPPSSCGYDSLQARIQPDITVDWNTQLAISSGEKVNLGCMHDGSGELAENVILVAEHSSGSKNEFNQNLVSQWEPSEVGDYTVWCESTDSQCTGLVSSTNATLSMGSVCKECPNDFHCYGPADDKVDFGYAWFATGYVMEGYVAQVPDTYCDDSGLVKPTWLGKGMGDANCNGQIDTYDFSLWNRELEESNGEDMIRNNWEADFTGPDGGVCDGVVDTYDFSLWNRSYVIFEGGED